MSVTDTPGNKPEGAGGGAARVDAGDLSLAAHRDSPTRWLAGLIVVGTVIRIPQLFFGLYQMYAFRQTQTAYVALEYARFGINPLHTPLPIFGPNADVPMEFPLVQAVAALLIKIGIGPDAAVRIIALAAFQAAAVLLTVLVLRWHGKLAAIVVLALFEFSPFGLAWGAASLIDFPAVALSLGMVVGLDTWFRSGSRTALLLAAVSGWLAFLVKATTPPAWCVLVLVSAATAYLTTRATGRIIAGLLVAPLPGAALALAWTRYGDSVKERNPLVHFLKSSQMGDWNFASLSQRLDPSMYIPALFRVSTEIAGPLGLGLLFGVAGIFLTRTKIERIRVIGWLATAAFAPLVFLNLYYHHSYYLIAIFPAVVAAVGIGIARIAHRVRWSTKVVATAGTALVVLGSLNGPDIWQWIIPPKPDPAGLRIKAATRPDDLIVVLGCDWDPTTLYFADRRGLMLRHPNLDNLGTWKYQNIDDYHYLFSCDPKLDITKYLPPGHVVIPTTEPDLWRISVP